jgi:hypothetical protein
MPRTHSVPWKVAINLAARGVFIERNTFEFLFLRLPLKKKLSAIAFLLPFACLALGLSGLSLTLEPTLVVHVLPLYQ